MSIRATAQSVDVLSSGDGKLRATSHSVNVLSSGDGKLRVTGQNVEVLSAYGASVTSRTVVTTMALVSVGGYEAAREAPFNTLAMTQETAYSPYNRSIISVLDVEQTAIVNTQEVEQLVSNLVGVLDHEATYTVRLYINPVEQTIDWIQHADTQIKARSVETDIDLEQTATGTRGTTLEQLVYSDLYMWDYVGRGGTFRYDLQTNLVHSKLITVQTYDGSGNPLGLVTIVVEDGLRQDVAISGTYNDFNDGNYIGIKDSVSYLKIPFIGTDAAATSTLSLTHAATDSYGVQNDLVLSTVATADQATGADHSSLDLNHSVVYSSPGQRAPEQTIGVTHSVSIIVPRTDCYFDISVGSTTVTGLPTPPVPPTLTPTDRISLAFPAAAPTTTLYFNAPEWGNIEEVYHERIDRHTRGGERIVYRDPTWRRNNVFKITLTAITEAETVNLLAFIKNSAGDVIKYTDHESRAWDVVILNPEEPFVRDRAGNTLALSMETI